MRGEQVYARCLACHALAYDRVGQAMKDSGLTWDAATLDRFLADPLKTVPGTAMTYAGVPDAGERADLIAYLRAAAASPACAGVATPH
ncbi:cytochrome c [Bordetella pertussis]|nr:cytochrome c [Bordetella pertussis]